LHCMLMI